MESQRVGKLNTLLEDISNTVDKEVNTKLDLDKSKRIIQRLSSFSSNCEECYQFFIDVENDIFQLQDKLDQLSEDDMKHHKQTVDNISSHLQKTHKLVTSGYYLSLYICPSA